jgi:hypothetical protein
MASTDGIEARLDALESREAISRLIADYGHAFDNHNGELLTSLWHEDANFDLGEPFGAFVGPAAILEGATELWADVPIQHHWMANVAIDLDGDTATSVTALDCFVTSVEAGPSMVGGQYIDRFERRNGVWKFADRKFDMAYFTPISDWSPVMGSEAATSDAPVA